MPSSHRSQPSRTSSARPSTRTSGRSSSRFSRTEIIINVYDLLPPSHLSSALWPLGLSLLHTGVVLFDREYAYGATAASPHHPPGTQTGVFWTRPRLEPPGGTFRCSVTQGITFATRPEIEALVRDVSAHFPGTGYNLLSNNCNHFTSALCRALTGRPAPAWINRASKVGALLPCLVPSGWLEPPDAEGAVEEGAGSEGSEDSDPDESSGMMQSAKRQQQQAGRASVDSRRDSVKVRDTSGRELPSSELAPADRLV